MSDEVVTAAPTAQTMDVRLPGWTSAVFGTIVLLLVLGILGRPSVFPDTASYMASGQDFWRTAASPLHLASPAKPGSAAVEPAGGPKVDIDESLTVLGARPPWYGVFAWPIERVGTLWLLAAVQSGMAAWLIWLAWRALAPGAPPWTAYAVQGVTGAFSTLPFIAGFAMPDVFVSCLIIAVTLLLVARDRLHRNECTGLAVIVCFSTIVHGANVFVAGAMVVLAGLMAFRARAFRGSLSAPIYMVITAIGIGMAASLLYGLKINLIYGHPPGRPPFLATRLIADGPGRSYLRQACTGHAAPYLLCRHKAEPLDNSQPMLWSLNQADGVFSASSPADRRVLQREEGRFVIGTILYAPAGVVATATANWIKELGMVYAEAPLIDQRMYFGRPENYPAELPRTNELYIPALIPELYRKSSLPTMIKRLGDCTGAEPACQPRLTMAAGAGLQIAEFLAACLALAVIAVQMIRRPPGDGRWLRALALVTFAVVVNALLCGAISGPFPRYQSAVAWLAVMMAGIGGCGLLAGAARPSAGQSPMDRSVAEGPARATQSGLV